MACRVKTNILKRPIGKQYHYVASYGGLNQIRYNSDETVIVEPIHISKSMKNELNENLISFYILGDRNSN